MDANIAINPVSVRHLIILQVKELGLLGMDCECLAQDFQKLFDVYWYLATPGNTLPSKGKWPDQFTALYNMDKPVTLTVNTSAPSSAFLAVSLINVFSIISHLVHLLS